MADVLAELVEKRRPASFDEYDRALREVVQEIMLLALWRAKFFERSAFYGGTALRILYGLDRFSEDLDFSLLAADPGFGLDGYFESMKRELQAFGLEATFERRGGSAAIDSAFAKMNTLATLVSIGAAQRITNTVAANRLIKIKFEVDLDPPGSFTTEAKYVLEPIPFAVKTFTLPSLFAGKMHALLARRWANRTNGRDWYDFVFFVARDVPVDLEHLAARLRASGHLKGDGMDLTVLRALMNDAIDRLDVDAAKAEVSRFLVDARSIEVWSKDFLRDLAARVRAA